MSFDFEAILKKCNHNSQLCQEVVDETLMYYAASRAKVEPIMEKRFKKYRSSFNKLGETEISQFKAQYLVHLLFRKNGIAARYNLKSIMRDFNEEQKHYVKELLQEPWFFTFSKILDNPAPDFYMMLDVFRDETFLLYSPAISTTLKERSVVLWNTLVGCNGNCWQTFGPVVGHCGLDEEDLFFFATEVASQSVYNEEDFIKQVESNPVPFMALSSMSNNPVVFNGNHEMRICITEMEGDNFPLALMQQDFEISEKQGVNQLSLNGVAGEPPHEAVLYYDTATDFVTVHALTHFGYSQLGQVLDKYGYELEEMPEVFVHLSMVYVMQEVLHKNPELFPYEDLFKEEKSPEGEAITDKLNAFLDDIMGDINEGRPPETAKVAARHGLDLENAEQIVKQMQEKLENMKNK